MKATWRLEPEERPNFTQLACLMGDFLEANVKQVILLLHCIRKIVDIQYIDIHLSKNLFVLYIIYFFFCKI